MAWQGRKASDTEANRQLVGTADDLRVSERAKLDQFSASHCYQVILSNISRTELVSSIGSWIASSICTNLLNKEAASEFSAVCLLLGTRFVFSHPAKVSNHSDVSRQHPSVSSALPRFAASQLGRLLPVVASVISNLRHAGHIDLCFGRHYSEHGFSAELKTFIIPPGFKMSDPLSLLKNLKASGEHHPECSAHCHLRLGEGALQQSSISKTWTYLLHGLDSIWYHFVRHLQLFSHQQEPPLDSSGHPADGGG